MPLELIEELSILWAGCCLQAKQTTATATAAAVMRHKKSKYNEKPINIDGLEFHNSPSPLPPPRICEMYWIFVLLKVNISIIVEYLPASAYGEGAQYTYKQQQQQIILEHLRGGLLNLIHQRSTEVRSCAIWFR